MTRKTRGGARAQKSSRAPPSAAGLTPCGYLSPVAVDLLPAKAQQCNITDNQQAYLTLMCHHRQIE